MTSDYPDHAAGTAETICAIATPPGVGGVGIVRVSGPAVPQMAQSLLGRLPRPRTATLVDILAASGELIDSGIALYFPQPRSFTGEHVLELQGHGGRFVLQGIVERLLELGARAARPGEFSQRAFLNDKLDLVQAEAIADLIESGTAAAARAAQRSLQGVFSDRVRDLQQQLTELRAFVEAAIDFPDEEIDFLAESDVLQRIGATQRKVENLLGEAGQGRLLRDGIVMAIVGRPNVGKSSLLNALSGQDSAIVTEIPGTTRDVLRELIDLDGIPVHVADTAGIRDSDDLIEAEGVRRARQALMAADLILLVEQAGREASPGDDAGLELPAGVKALRVYNKTDLLPAAEQADRFARLDPERVWISALTGQGLQALRQRIGAAIGAGEPGVGSFSARQRHVDALQRVCAHLAAGAQVMEAFAAGELLAEELRLSQCVLGEITGEMLADDLLGAIFSSFCIGK
ncbi:MAG: tRNA uridine-5-carboxymethylaminomethyl(34) synthesis GTPase MnmE [Xanthomonadales bacterium]|nr:tRNA uridine-5-carboxymethylaminomethyl(34) synthesis GTPase MnmE [Xanthomonadales bacterium]